jgi:ABC-type spermidine/putrescine transport system permease subunit II
VLPGLVSGWALAYHSFDEVTMTVFIAAPGDVTCRCACSLIQDKSTRW